MSAFGVTDHALLRFLERGGGLEIEALRVRLAASLARAHAAARSVTTSDYLIRADGMIFVVKGDAVVTVLPDDGPGDHARRFNRPQGGSRG